MAPFDREFHFSLGVGVGGIRDFKDDAAPPPNSPAKPWRNTQVKAMRLFWDAMKGRSDWPGVNSGLEVDYVRVYSL